MVVIRQHSYSGTHKRLIVGLAGLILACQIMLGNNLLNIDFGVGTSSQKQGYAAIGNSPADFWNLYSRDDGAEEVIDLVWSDGRVSSVDLTVVNAPGAWGNESPDPMFGVYLYPFNGENITVTLEDLPSGSYALYVYAHGALDGENGVVEVTSGGSTWGPLNVSTGPGWNVPAWENGRQYVQFDAVAVGADHQMVITVYPGETGLAVLNGMQLIQQSISPSANLINVDFSGHQNPSVRQKSGPAVWGYNAEDVWNLYSRDDGGGGFLESGGLANLVTAEGSPTGAGLSVQNAPGFWIASHSDAMLDSYLYPLAGGEIVVTVTNLSSGRYDLLFYAHGYLDGENGDIQVRAGDVDYGAKVTIVSANWQNLPWQEGVQYVRFQGLSVSANVPLVITVRPGTTGLAVMNGMQLLRQSECSAPSGLVAWWPGEGDGMDVVGGSDGELVNGLGFADGLVGQAMVFDGVDDHVRIPFSESLASETFSMEAWIKPLGPVMDPQWNQDFVFGQALGSPWLVVRPGTGGVRPVVGLFVNPFLYPEVESSVELPLDKFSHVACTWDGIGLRIYVNGVLAGETFPSETPVPSTCDFYIGGHLGSCAGYDFDGGYFHGSVDELSLYGRALTVAEIAAIHAAGNAGKCPPVGYILTVETTPGGIVLRDPDRFGYRSGESVTLTAVPDAGFAFDHWEGDASGTEPEVTLLMDGSKYVTARFVDIAAPIIEIESPVAGVTEIQNFVLSGAVMENQQIAWANWEWNGHAYGLPVISGRFYVDGLQLVLGENRIRVVVVDVAGNEGSSEIVVEWVPARLLSIVDPAPRQEGRRIHIPIQLTSSGEVGGASFVVRYDPWYLMQPAFEWSPSVISALNQVNTEIRGEVRATFALPALAVPAGTRTLGVLTIRARSVPEDLTIGLNLRLLDISNTSGDSIAAGSAVRSGLATVLVRRIVGDNNANQRLDVGDATLIQRLLTGIDPVRTWDRTGNDVNQNTELDSGDVIRVLRAAVGLDPQPTAPSGEAESTADSFSVYHLSPMADEVAGTLLLEADRLHAVPGELVTVRVRLADVITPIAALAMNLEYPPDALRLLNPQSHRVGELVPATAVAVWNVAPAQSDYTLQSGAVSLALSSAIAWPSSEGVVAEFTFQVQEGQTMRHQWPIRVSQTGVSADGYDMTAVADATVDYVGRDPLLPELTPVSADLGEDGFAFSFLGEAGVEYVIEVSSDLAEWIPLGTRQGANESITILDPAALGTGYRFYRVRFE